MVKCFRKTTIKDKPWITKSIKNAGIKKNFLYKQFIKYRCDKNLQRYKTYKNRLTSVLRLAERHYYKQELTKYKSNLKCTWKLLNSVLNKKTKDQPLITCFIQDNKIIENRQDIANGFNDFFINIGPKLASTIPNVNDRHFLDYISNFVTRTIFLKPVTEIEVLDIVYSFKAKYSCGFDNISMYVIKNVIGSIVKPLVYICNLSLQTGVFPNDMKVAKIIPIHKADDNNIFCNYRPISLLSQFSKILEKIFNVRLLNFLNSNNVLHNEQYGFRQNYSTELAVLEMIDKITTSIDNKRYCIGIFIDLKKAFDTLNHEILVEKLKSYGIRGVDSHWICSYLKQRKQYVHYDSVNSTIREVQCGVPQGSILGPSLFLLYINDLCNASPLLKFVLLADDTNIFYENFDKGKLEETINNELEEISLWFKVNRLSLNIKKTNYIVFGSRNSNVNFNIHINNIKIDRVNDTKFLGVHIDANLSWSKHLNVIQKKVSKSIGVMSGIKNKLNEETKLTLYSTLILPHLTYCCSIWGNTYKSRLSEVIKLQKKALRIVYNKPFYAPTNSLFQKARCLKLEDLIKLNTNVIMYKAFNNLLPQNLQCIFSNVKNVHDYSTRQKHNLYKTSVRTNVKNMTFSKIGINLWNQLDDHIKLCYNIHLFKKKLKQLYVDTYCD